VGLAALDQLLQRGVFDSLVFHGTVFSLARAICERNVVSGRARIAIGRLLYAADELLEEGCLSVAQQMPRTLPFLIIHGSIRLFH
jgi:hypothetical protein